MFINFSNHPSEKWSYEQRQAALQYGDIADIPFPNVDADCSESTIRLMAKEYADRIIDMRPDYVLCQGEFCLAYNVISLLKESGVHVGAACSERESQESTIDGKTEKISVFRFVRFREY